MEVWVPILSLFGLLQFASLIGISNITIFGDSKVLIEWLNDLSNIQVLLLNHWLQKVLDLRSSFSLISFRLISRIFNARVDALSNNAIPLKFGLLRFQEILEGTLIHEGKTNLIDLM